MGTEVTKENENYVTSLEETILGYDTYFSLNKLQIIPKRIANISRILKMYLLNKVNWKVIIICLTLA